MQGDTNGFEFLKNAPFKNIFRSFRVAIQPSKLLIALAAVIVLVAAGMLMDLRPTVAAMPDMSPDHLAMWPLGSAGDITNQPTELHASIINPQQVPRYVEAWETAGEKRGVYTTMRYFCGARLASVARGVITLDLETVVVETYFIARSIAWAARRHTLYSLIYAAISLAVFAFVGGAICRSAALQLGRDERPGLLEALRFSARKWTSFFVAPLWGIGIVALAAIFLSLIGLLGNIPAVGAILLGILSPLAILVGFVMTLFLIGTFAGASIMMPAVAFEGADGMDAMGRAFGYVYMRPWRAAFYAVVAGVYGIICYLFVRLFAWLLLAATRLSMAFGVFRNSPTAATPLRHEPMNQMDAIWPAPEYWNLMGPWRPALGWPEAVAAVLVRIPQALVAALVAAFVISFYFSACTAIYALLRKNVDGEDMSHVYIDADKTAVPNDSER